MFVKFVKPSDVYNSNYLTLGNIYEVLNIALNNRDMLFIINDYGEGRYYHKSLFIDAEFDNSGILSFITEDEKKKLFSYDVNQVYDIVKAVDDFDKILHGRFAGADLLKSVLKIIKRYPEIDIINIYLNKMDNRVYPVKAFIKSEQDLERLSDKKYKLGTDDTSVRIVHKDDLFLIGKTIYLPIE